LEVRLDIKGEELLERVIGKPVFLQELEKLTAKVLEEELEEKHDIKSIEVSLTFVEPDEMLELNEQYRGIDEPTDVLSFPLWEEEDGSFLLPSKDWDEVALGDIVNCNLSPSCDRLCSSFRERARRRDRVDLHSRATSFAGV